MARLIIAGLLIWFGWPAMAHVSERAIVLLLPTDLYSAFGVLAVMLTVVLTVVVPSGWFTAIYREPRDVEPGKSGNLIHVPAFLVFAGLIAIGIWGPRDPLVNLLPLTVFTAWWIVALIIQGSIGNIWHLLSPWTAPVNWAFGDRSVRPLPEGVASWPAVVGLLLYGAYYLTDLAPDDPARLAMFAGLYWVFTFVMCGLFGRIWLEKSETFTVIFNLVGRLALFQRLRPQVPGNRIVHGPEPDMSLAIMSVTFLAIGSFDGLNETFWWFGKIGINPLEFAGRSSVVVQNLIGLGVFVVALNLIFAATVWGGYLLTGRQGDFGPLYRRLALTVLPIGIGYHLAHYLTTVMVNLQYWVAALDDPLKSGWHFLGMDGFHVTTGFLNQYDTVTRIWLTQAGAIVVGHMVAVILAHAISLRVFDDHKTALKSQVFLAVFMVGYTLFGLWLLASPTAL